MAADNSSLLELTNRDYKAGFVTDIESETLPPGLNEDVVRAISARKGEPEWLLEWRLKSYRHWLTMKEPTWQNVHYPAIDYQSIVYYSAPKVKKDGPKSLEEVDPKLLETYEKLGIPLRERAKLAGVAVDAVFDSVSSRRRSAESSPRSESSSVPSPKRSATIPISSASTSARSCRTRTTTSRR